MTLAWLLILPALAGLLAWLAGRWNPRWSRWICLVALAIMLVLTLSLWDRNPVTPSLSGGGEWIVQLDLPWIPALGIRMHLAMDGLSLLMVLLTAFLGLVSVAASWTEITERVGFFHFHLMWVLAGVVGVFLALDLFLFYFFWEVMLVPMYFLIALWGHENRVYASIKFFLFTQISGLLMLAAILGLYFVHHHNTGVYTFDYTALLGTSMPASTAMWLMLGFFIAFAVKLPSVPVHTWLADAHTEAPTAGSVILAGLLLKTGAYGLLRFAVPLFPEAAMRFAAVGMLLAVVSILYGALLAFGQTDLKRLVAYTSVSHMGFVLLGVFAWNQMALQGVVMQMLAHGISTGALFVLAGALQERTHTRDMGRMGGLWATMPRFAGVALLFAMASLGLPGLGNFVAEILVLLGTYRVSVTFASLAVAGLVGATVYALWLVQATFHGPNREGWVLPDLSLRETAVAAAMTLVILWLGVYPQPILNTAGPALESLRRSAASVTLQLEPEGKATSPERGQSGLSPLGRPDSTTEKTKGTHESS
jgi:NADH-quinone oxidoreductase subunit M